MAEAIKLFEQQKKIYPRDAWGRYRRLKWLAMGVLLAIYYFTPWLRWDRGPHAPDQAILIDMPARRAYFFGIEIWPQEVYILVGLLVLAAVGLFFVTSLFGRVWCGYACPQTVWTDLYLKVEHFFQGDRNARQKLDTAPWSMNKVWRKVATHAVWLLIALCTGGAWVFYFSDAPTLAGQLVYGDVPASTWGWILGLTASTYLMAGWAREQVCTYMCPYARFQSAMFDKDTLIISYDAGRGEPRGAHKKGESWEGRGDCVDCSLCVQVCPMGIDIRDGLQMQCIACGLCVDACNSIMDKVGRPQGLIRYDTTHNQTARDAARRVGAVFKDNLRLLRPRSVYYTVIVMVVSALTLYALLSREPFDLHVQHDRNPLFVRLTDGGVRNNFTIKVLNKANTDKRFSLQVQGLPAYTVKIEGAGHLVPEDLPVLANSVAQFRVLLTVPDTTGMPQRSPLRFVLTEAGANAQDSTDSMFIARE